MKRFVAFLIPIAAALILSLGIAECQVTIPRVDPGPRLIDGAIINQLIDRLSGSGSPGFPASCSVTGASPQTCNGYRGTVTTGTLTTAGVTNAAFTINNNIVTATSIVSCDISGYTGTLVTNGIPVVTTCVASAGVLTANVTNVHASNALNGAVTINFIVFN